MAMRTIFLETAFWDYFSKCYGLLFADPYLAEDVPEKISRWNNLDKFIRRSSVFIDTPLYELAEKAKEDTRLRFLLKSNGDGNMELDYQEDPFPDLESNNKLEYESDCSSIYFTASDHQKAAKRHGVINICNNNIWNQNEKFIDSGAAIKNDQKWNWKDLQILKENSNGVVLIDNFILSPNIETGIYTISPDLKDLLAQILPEFSIEKYVLSIFYYDKEMDGDWDWDNNRAKMDKLFKVENHKNQYSKSIKNFLKETKRQLDITIELFPTRKMNRMALKKDFHDRTIITNNILVGCEGGFDIREKKRFEKATKSTTVHALYLGFGCETASWLEGTYDQLIADAKQCLKKYGYTTKNRILQ